MNDWYNFMQSKPVRIVLNSICAVICGSYAVSGVMELANPNDMALMLKEQVGSTGYLVLTIARIVVCLWVAFVFCRMTLKTIRDEDEK